MSEPTVEERKLTAIEELLKKKANAQTEEEAKELVTMLQNFFDTHHVCPKCASSDSLPLTKREYSRIITRAHVGVKSDHAAQIDEGLSSLLHQFRALRKNYLLLEMSEALIKKAELLP
jgi:hypothetical protein